MTMINCIEKTRQGVPLATDELSFIVQGFTTGEIPDYQMSAWLMAVTMKGISDRETTDLTLAMVKTGRILNWENYSPSPIDKHSTGGVGDTTTLLLLPLIAACGATAAKMSGRGLGFTGGTLDKLDSIPGFRSILPTEVFSTQLKKYHIALTGQSPDLAPADGKIYALRDVSGSVESLPLIASSIMSKKLAAGCPGIVIDVKVGSGGFMKDRKSAEKLARLMIKIGSDAGRKVVAYLTSMEQPLGNYVGNALEVEEAYLLLQSQDLTSDLAQVTLHLAGEILWLSNITSTQDEGVALVQKKWLSGEALNKFKEWIRLQQGNLELFEKKRSRFTAFSKVVVAEKSGFVARFFVNEIGFLARDLGAGRISKEDLIDYQAGLTLHQRLGSAIQKGDPWVTLYSSKPIDSSMIQRANLCMEIAASPPKQLPLILDRLS